MNSPDDAQGSVAGKSMRDLTALTAGLQTLGQCDEVSYAIIGIVYAKALRACRQRLVIVNSY